jgi:spermidine/putrescine transport system ATP-binding protein
VNTVFQSYALFDHLSVWDNVAFGLRRKKVGKAEVRQRVGEMLELVQLTGRDKDMPRELSGGQRQRVALARALVNRPSVLLLDEPLAALDLKLRRAMQVELKRIQREVGITFIFVTHDQDEALTMSDQIAVMSEGQVHQCGTPEDIYERPATAFVAGFIGTANRMTGTYRDGAVFLAGDMRLPTGRLEGHQDGDDVTIAVRPEKIWVSDLTPEMVQTDGLVTATVYGGPTTTYLMEIAPGVELAVLEQNLQRARTEDRWKDGERVRIGWLPEHCLVLH